MSRVNAARGKTDNLGVGADKILPSKTLGKIFRIEKNFMLWIALLKILGGAGWHRGFNDHYLWRNQRLKSRGHCRQISPSVRRTRRGHGNKNNFGAIYVVKKTLGRINIVQK